MNLTKIENWIEENRDWIKNKSIDLEIKKNEYNVRSISIDFKNENYSGVYNVWENDLMEWNLINNNSLSHQVKYFEDSNFETFCTEMKLLIDMVQK